MSASTGAYPEESGAAIILVEPKKDRACRRCKGLMLLDREGGDYSCFTCGHIDYHDTPIDIGSKEGTIRHPTHGGISLV